MTTIGLLIVVSCGLTWATFDAQRKLLVQHLGPVEVTALLAIAQTPLFGAWLVFEGSWHIAPGYWLPATAVGAANLAASLLFFEALRRAPLSTMAPLLSLTPVFSALFADLALGETLAPTQQLGIACVVVGAFLLSLPAAEGDNMWSKLRQGEARSASLLMVLAAASWSITIVFDKAALQHASLPMHASLQLLVLSAVLLVVMAMRRRLGEFAGVRHCKGTFIAAVLIGTAALGLQLVAIQIAFVGLVEGVKRAIGVLLAILYGKLIFGEPMTLLKGVAAVVMIGGVTLVVA